MSTREEHRETWCGVEEDTSELWMAYKGSSSAEARDALVVRYMPLVRRIAQRSARMVPQAVDVEDMVAAGHLGLLDALESYDLQRGIRFSTFCTYRVRGAILDELRALDWVPRAVRHNTRQVDRATNRLTNRLSRPPTQDELAGEIGVGPEMAEKMRKDADGVNVLSIDRQNPNTRDSTGSWSETIRDRKQSSPLSDSMRSELRSELTRNLSRAERMIITLYYFEGMTMKEIGQTLNLSESRVSQVHASVLVRLRYRVSPGPNDREGYRPVFRAA